MKKITAKKLKTLLAALNSNKPLKPETRSEIAEVLQSFFPEQLPKRQARPVNSFAWGAAALAQILNKEYKQKPNVALRNATETMIWMEGLELSSEEFEKKLDQVKTNYYKLTRSDDGFIFTKGGEKFVVYELGQAWLDYALGNRDAIDPANAFVVIARLCDPIPEK